MSFFKSLTFDQKQSIGLLQIGTFLEYFDLMLYVHMAVVLNEIFFKPTDPYTTSILAAFAFSSTYLLRPIGALIFGWIGDNIGRKPTVIIATIMMSVSCLIMANLPTYAQIGLTASIVVTICRVLQGMSSMGEMIGAQIYITEMIKPPLQYSAVSFLSVASSLGATSALGIGVLATKASFDWRIAFWVGAFVAVIGATARTRLRETPDFTNAKKKFAEDVDRYHSNPEIKEEKIEKVNEYIDGKVISKKTSLAFFAVYCGWPVSFYILYMYFNPMLQSQCGYTSYDIVFHNFILSIGMIVFEWFWARLSYKINPLLISKYRAFGSLFLGFSIPFLLNFSLNNIQIFSIQLLIMLCQLGYFPGCAIFLKHFPILRRFTWTSMIYALTRSIMYPVTSFGMVFLTAYIDQYGLMVLMVFSSLAYLLGIYYFQVLEKKTINQEELDRRDMMNLAGIVV